MRVKTLKVRAVGDILVQDYVAMAGKPGNRRYVGRKYNQAAFDAWNSLPQESKPPFSEVMSSVFVNTGEVVEVPNTKEFRHEIQKECLEACDFATAEECGLMFYHVVTV